MALDILKFLVLYLLVLFAFGCGMNQLLWYYADLEYTKCYSLPGGLPGIVSIHDPPPVEFNFIAYPGSYS